MRTAFAGRGLLACVVFPALVLAPLGCKHKKVRTQQTEEEAPRLASTIHMGDPRMASQLVGGFYGIEANAWRWSARRFAVALRPPLGSAQRGASLVLKLTVPPVVVATLKEVTLSASVGGTALPPETYRKPGDYTYQREVAPTLLAGEAVRVEFQLDKAMPPKGTDERELGVVVLSAGLESK